MDAQELLRETRESIDSLTKLKVVPNTERNLTRDCFNGLFAILVAQQEQITKQQAQIDMLRQLTPRYGSDAGQ